MAKPALPIWIEKDKAYAWMMGDGYSNALFVGAPDRQDKFYSEVKLEFWGEEKLELKHEGRAGIPFVEDIPGVDSVEPDTPARKIVLEDADYREEWFTPDQKNFKWVRVFKKKPTSNVFVWKIRYAERYHFYYQTPFRQEFPDLPESAFREYEEEGEPWIEVDHGGKWQDARPVNIEGSIAVYHKTKRHHRVGDVNYRMGKVLHFPRPEVVDAEGTRWRCDIAVVGDEYQLTIPQDAIDKGVLPLKVNDTLGYWCSGASTTSCAENQQYACGPWAGADGSATHVNLYWTDITELHDGTVGFWKDNAGVPDILMADSAEIRVVSPVAWQQIALDSPTAISSGDSYHIGFNSIDQYGSVAGYTRWYYDTVSNIDLNTDPDTYVAGTLQNFDVNATTTDRAYSGYLTYTAGGAVSIPVIMQHLKQQRIA